MSLTFSEIVTKIDDEVKSNSVSFPLAKKVVEINSAMDEVLTNIFEVGGTWQFDDGNHTDYPFILADINAGQRDYQFVEDGSNNLILEIQKVLVANSEGIYQEMRPVDQQSDPAMHNFWDGQDVQAMPYRYDKTANAVFLDPIPDYTETNGLKIFISRESTYFTVDDTTKKAGYWGLQHKYLVYYAAYEYASRNGLKTAPAIYEKMQRSMRAIRTHYAIRQKDTKPVIRERRKRFK
jgi:hypothetical protein